MSQSVLKRAAVKHRNNIGDVNHCNGFRKEAKYKNPYVFMSTEGVSQSFIAIKFVFYA